MPNGRMRVTDRKASRRAEAERGEAASAPAPIRRLFEETRSRSLALVEGLSPEDMVVQSMEDASPAKWHLAHATWFFEQFVLIPLAPGYRPHDERFLHCFNSYYVQVGSRHARPRRGLLTRPTADEVIAYRHGVDDAVAGFLASDADGEAFGRVELGCHHEMQHQELLLTDLLHAFSFNPLAPAYRAPEPLPVRPAPEGEPEPVAFAGGVVEVGHAGGGFAFDNEGPRHAVLLRPFRLAARPVTNREWLAFMSDGGYDAETLWLSDGWAERMRQDWQAPLYWTMRDGEPWSFGLRGLQPVDLDAPVAHVSYFEADAFARWAGRRLPSEHEWEHAAAAARSGEEGGFLEGRFLRPRPVGGGDGLSGMQGEVWQWTQSAYGPYPGFRPAVGALGEYNGKFMVSQWVLRGASCLTPRASARRTYRNFFHPHQRWQVAGLRLAEDA